MSDSRLEVGFAGVVCRGDCGTRESMFADMLKRMSFRSDVEPAYCSPESGVWVGASSQAEWVAGGRIGVISFGEFNVGDHDVGDLALNGPRTPEKQSLYVGKLYERLGDKCFEQLNGWFGGMIIDLLGNKCVLFTDRYGLGRVYIASGSDYMLFSSEAKSILALVEHRHGLDQRSFGEWLTCGCSLQNRTIFSKISILPCGSTMTLSKTSWQETTAYAGKDRSERLPRVTNEEYCSRLLEVFPRALERIVRADESAGMSLTGGLDGRMIMAWCGRKSGGLPCYSFNGPYRECVDVRLGRKIAIACGQTHQTISVGADFLDDFSRLAENAVCISDGAMDVTGAVELYVNNLARGIAPIRLTGNYGSEILRSQLALKPRDDADVFVSGEMKGQMATARDTYAVEFRGRLLSFIAYKQVPWHHFGRFAIERSQVRVRSPFLDNDLVSLAYQAPDESLRALEPSLIVIAAGNPRLASIPTDRGVVYPSNVFVDGIRRRWHDFMAKVEYAFDYGMPQWLAGVNRACGPLHLDQAFLGIQKFYHFRGWYQRELRKYVQDVLLDERTLSRPYLNRKAVERLVDAHVQGRGNYTMAIHKLLTSEIIQRKLIEQR